VLQSAVVVVALVAAVPGQAASRCDRWAAPGGSDAAPGTASRPFRSARVLVSSLAAGESGCLRPGLYAGDLTIDHGGRPGRPLILRGVPARAPVVRGILSITRSAHDVELRGLRLDGSNPREVPSPQVNGSRVTFSGNDVTNGHTSSCFILGGSFERYGIARGTRIIGNRIHACGRLPATGHDHGIYVEGSRDALIRGNQVVGNADYGIHLYPWARSTRIERNVIHRNGGGVIIAGESAGGEYGRAYASSRNVVARNVISGSRRLPNVEAYWGGPAGAGNRVWHNCLWRPRRGEHGHRGVSVRANVFADPRLEQGPGGWLEPTSGPCRRVTGWR
jgi:hypothetical protein